MSLLKDIWRLVLPGPEPTLDLDFTAEALDPRITFTRASTKTYFDSAGFLRTAAANEWPREYDPSTVTRVNYLRGSRSLEGTFDTNVVKTPSYSVGPDGAVSGILVSSTVTAVNSQMALSMVVTPPANTPILFWAYLRAGSLRYIRLRPQNLDTAPFAEFDLVAGTIVGSSDPSAFIEPVGDGIYRVGLVYPGGADTNGILTFAPLQSPGVLIFQPLDGTQNFEFFGAQAETSATPTELIETGSVPAGDATCLGRSVWEQRTNTLLRSQEFDSASWAKTSSSVSANAAVAPDGTNTAEKLIEPSGGINHPRVQQNFVVPAAVTLYAFSIFAKAGERTQVLFGAFAGSGLIWPTGIPPAAVFDLLTGEVVSQGGAVTFAHATPLPDGWFRLEVRGTSSGTGGPVGFAAIIALNGQTTYTGDGTSGIYIWGAQLESAAVNAQTYGELFATPYIPTTTAAATRVGDNGYAALATSPQKGTFLAEAKLGPSLALGLFSQTLASVSSSTNTGIHLDVIGSNGGFRCLVWSGGSTAAGANLTGMGTVSAGEYAKAAVSFAQDDIRAAANANTAVSDASATIPAATRFELGNFFGANQRSLNGYLQRARLWDTPMSSEELQGLTG